MNKILIIAANFYDDLTEELIKGATHKLHLEGFEADIIKVPGALEIPIALSMALDSGKYAGYIALGCIIRGETYHFEVVSNESVRAITEVATYHKVAIGNGILTVENEEQAWERASTKVGNKGAAAANACIELIRLRDKLGK